MAVFSIDLPRAKCCAIASNPVIGEKADTPMAWCNLEGEIRNRFRNKDGSQT